MGTVRSITAYDQYRAMGVSGWLAGEIPIYLGCSAEIDVLHRAWEKLAAIGATNKEFGPFVKTCENRAADARRLVLHACDDRIRERYGSNKRVWSRGEEAFI